MMWYMRMDKIVDAIEDAIEKRCFLPALALSLVIPDICAEYDYPEIYNKKAEYNGRKGQGAAYSKWYDENIGNYDIDPLTGMGLLDGRSCWKLRCELLHNGSIDLDDFMSVDDKHITFKLTSSQYSDLKGTIGGCSGVKYSEDKTNRDIELDIVNLCGKILAVLRYSYLTDDNFIKATENKALNYIEY